MNNYFVEGHLGGYYISNRDPEDIEEVCEECCDYDMILFSFDDEDKDEPFKSFSEFLIKDLVFTKEKLESRLHEYTSFGKTIKQAVSELKGDILFDIDNNKDMIRSLLETGDIDKKTCDKLIKYLNKALKMQYSYLNNFDYSTINLKKSDIKENKKR